MRLLKKNRLLEQYRNELIDALEKGIDKAEKKTSFYAYTFDPDKAKEACNEYIPIEKRNYFKKRELERGR